ncbi:MAG: HD domain-containing protein [Anaerolineales bacterium]|nr:HD domain-containing protein [Anaerolineales bacterium]
MIERLLELVPEFDLIGDGELREKCLKAWVGTMEEGGWTPDDLTKMPFTLLIDPCPASYIEHVRAVTLTALRTAEVFEEIYGDRVPVNKDDLIAGGLMHDIGKLLEYEKRADGSTVQTKAGKLLRHPFSGMELAARYGLSVEIQHIIAAHAGEGDKVNRTTEATLVNHADFSSFHSIQRMLNKKELGAKMG